MDSAQIPDLALSVRQPWAYALAMGWKPVENRSWRRPNPGLNFRGPFAIHASLGLTRREYEQAQAFFRSIGFHCPPAHDLVRGAIIGVAEVVDVVRKSDSAWFFGPVGLVIANPRLLAEPIPCAGQLGFFAWSASGGAPAAPARWMVPTPAVQDPRQQLLFGSTGNCGGYDG